MRIHCKVVVIAVCFGVFLLLYFLGGNAADDPLLREVAEQEEKKKEEESNSSRRSHSDFGRDVAKKFAKKSPVEEPLQGRKERKAINRGVNAKSLTHPLTFPPGLNASYAIIATSRRCVQIPRSTNNMYSASKPDSRCGTVEIKAIKALQ
ncbi:hypothetical protein NQZ68_032563 [Dissostichus eleginoides]|nr:hypothetical protein NQZ68_032563 [Dissostichus eleginoides]